MESGDEVLIIVTVRFFYFLSASLLYNRNENH